MMPKPQNEISRNRRYNLLCIPWTAAVVLTFPGVFMFPQFFPAGFFRFLGVKEADAIARSWVVLGWMIYLGLTIAACLSRRRISYFIVYSVLCVLIALNIAGCRAFLSDFRGVQ
jgi:hypothetical protein